MWRLTRKHSSMMRTNRGSSLHWGKGGRGGYPTPRGTLPPRHNLSVQIPAAWTPYPLGIPYLLLPKGPGTRDTLLSPGKDIGPVTRKELGTRDTPTPSPPPPPPSREQTDACENKLPLRSVLKQLTYGK